MLSAGLIPYRIVDGELEILIAHPGGPIWARRQNGAWSAVKGVVMDDEAPFDAAVREFAEETGWPVDPGNPISLGEVVLRSGKTVTVWAFEADYDPVTLDGDQITMSWYGRKVTFPEIDEVRWCRREEAERLLNPAQAVFFERLRTSLSGPNRDGRAVPSNQ